MNFDVVIIGSGLSGITIALHLSKNNKVILITKKKLLSGASTKAQGGIAGVLNTKIDKYKNHIKDTLKAGVNLCNKKSVNFIIKKAPKAINWLIKQGIIFTKKNNLNKKFNFHLNIEGGHKQRRILHIKDKTGFKIQKILIKKIKNKKNITILENHFAIDIIVKKTNINKLKCTGIKILDLKKNKIITIYSKHIILATGGVGMVYSNTSNPNSSTGDGIAIAARAGCRIINMEFIQFHPTCLYKNFHKKFLISESLRGEGAILTIPKKKINFPEFRFMFKYDKRLELAPRDIISRAIYLEMKKLKLNFINLNINHKSLNFIKKHFPSIYNNCLLNNINIAKNSIAIAPAAHYTCGGIFTNLNGCTDIKGLYAIGETAYTGLHGANRLASNSLLECLVLSKNTAKYINKQLINNKKNFFIFKNNLIINLYKNNTILKIKKNLRFLMWKYAGIIRKTKKLILVKKYVLNFNKEINKYFKNKIISKNILELRNLIEISLLIINSALKRKESRGTHYNKNYIKKKNIITTTIIRSKNII